MTRVSLGDVCERVDYGLSTSATVAGDARFLRITDIEGSHIDWKAVPFCAASDAEIRKYALTTGDVVVARTGASTGRSQWVKVEEPSVFASYLVRFRAGDRLNSRYLGYVLSSASWLHHVSSVAHGKSAQPNMSASAMAEFMFDLPSLGEQRAIAEVLGALDDKIAANDRVIHLVDDLVEAQFELLAKGRGQVALDEIAVVNRSVTKPKSGGSLRYLDISSVGQGDYEFPGLLDWHEAPGRARRVLSFGDTVWSTVRPNRRSHALVLDDDPLLIASTGLAVLSPKAGRVAGLYEASRREEFVAYLESVAEGSAYPAVRAERFRDAPVPDLSSDEWDGFERFALPMRKRAHAAVVESRHLAQTRDELLPLLTSGRLRVKDAEKTVEKVL